MHNNSFSIICPIRNEEEYIGSLISFLDTINPKPREVIFIDGESTDNTIKIINTFITQSNTNFIVLNNPDKLVPFALNIAIPKCTGEIIVRIDAHTKYDKDYFYNILKTFNEIDADIVGGPTRTAFKNSFQESIAYVFNTKLGMGNSSVHDVNYTGYTDSVTFGAWKRTIFETTGLFDTNFKRNQDDEFHYRAKSLGFKIYQHPDIKLYYYPRSNYTSLFKQYFEYGLYKPLVLQKIKSEVKLRHLVPTIFVTYLIITLILLISGLFNEVILIPVVLYLLLTLFFSFNNKLSLKAKLISVLAYPTIHIAYGSGFIIGLKKIVWQM